MCRNFFAQFIMKKRRQTTESFYTLPKGTSRKPLSSRPRPKKVSVEYQNLIEKLRAIIHNAPHLHGALKILHNFDDYISKEPDPLSQPSGEERSLAFYDVVSKSFRTLSYFDLNKIVSDSSLVHLDTDDKYVREMNREMRKAKTLKEHQDIYNQIRLYMLRNYKVNVLQIQRGPLETVRFEVPTEEELKKLIVEAALLVPTESLLSQNHHAPELSTALQIGHDEDFEFEFAADDLDVGDAAGFADIPLTYDNPVEEIIEKETQEIVIPKKELISTADFLAMAPQFLLDMLAENKLQYKDYLIAIHHNDPQKIFHNLTVRERIEIGDLNQIIKGSTISPPLPPTAPIPLLLPSQQPASSQRITKVTPRVVPTSKAPPGYPPPPPKVTRQKTQAPPEPPKPMEDFILTAADRKHIKQMELNRQDLISKYQQFVRNKWISKENPIPPNSWLVKNGYLWNFPFDHILLWYMTPNGVPLKPPGRHFLYDSRITPLKSKKAVHYWNLKGNIRDRMAGREYYDPTFEGNSLLPASRVTEISEFGERTYIPNKSKYDKPNISRQMKDFERSNVLKMVSTSNREEPDREIVYPSHWQVVDPYAKEKRYREGVEETSRDKYFAKKSKYDHQPYVQPSKRKLLELLHKDLKERFGPSQPEEALVEFSPEERPSKKVRLSKKLQNIRKRRAELYATDPLDSPGSWDLANLFEIDEPPAKRQQLEEGYYTPPQELTFPSDNMDLRRREDWAAIASPETPVPEIDQGFEHYDPINLPLPDDDID